MSLTHFVIDFSCLIDTNCQYFQVNECLTRIVNFCIKQMSIFGMSRKLSKIGLVYTALFLYGGRGWGGCRVILITNPTAVEVKLVLRLN